MSDLMKPRYEVISDYPNTELNIGEIIEFEVNEETGVLYTPISSEDDTTVGVDCFNQFPHIFPPLAWYEKRDIKDMPEYVKYDGKVSRVVSLVWDGDTPKQVKWDGSVMGFHLDNQYVLRCFYWSEVTPATSTEYDNYIKQKI